MRSKLILPEKWRIVKDEVSSLGQTLPSTFLHEDMFQAIHSKYIIDAGWYEGTKCFITYLIKDLDWDEPLMKIKSANLEEVERGIKACAEYIDSNN